MVCEGRPGNLTRRHTRAPGETGLFCPMVWGKIILSHTMGQFIYVGRVADRVRSREGFQKWKRIGPADSDQSPKFRAHWCKKPKRRGALIGSGIQNVCSIGGPGEGVPGGRSDGMAGRPT